MPPSKGTIRGTHHLTFCVGGAQEDYDFHVRTLGLKSVKKTVLFDGEIPIYHLYYGNGAGDASTILTAFPYRQAGWMGRRGTNQLRTLLLSVPTDAIGFWADRLSAAGIESETAELFGTHPPMASRIAQLKLMAYERSANQIPGANAAPISAPTAASIPAS